MNHVHAAATQPQGQAASPPPSYLQALAPLSAAEINSAVSAIKSDVDLGPGALFGNIDLREPSPQEWRDHLAGKAFRREARLNISHLDRPGVWMVFVALDNNRIIFRRHFPSSHSAFQVEQLLDVERKVKADPNFIEACRKRGITDMTGVCVDSWSGGNFGDAGEEGHMVSYVHCWLRLYENENFYAHPIDGLNVAIDVKTGEILRIDDHGGPPIPMIDVPYDPDFMPTRAPMKPLNVVQPEGTSFTMDGHAIAWDKWTLGIGYSPRDGIILHDVRYDGRPIVRRMALGELVVPYGSPERGHYRKNIFDIGEYGFGKFNHSLKLGCDCLGSIHYLDSHFCGLDGGVITIEKGICIHEEDTGVLWKHWDFRVDRTEVRRGRRLVISCINTVGNYEYGQYWYFDQAGQIECEVKATGIVDTMACDPGDPGKFAAEVSPGLSAPIHQHIFCVRMDMNLDGGGNSVVEANSYAEPMGPTNRFGNGFYAEETTLKTELEAGRKANLDTHRTWKIVNPNKLNALGKPVGYRLHAPDCVTPMTNEAGPSGIRSNFIRNHLWVTPYNENERYPAGEYVCNSDGSDGLAEVVKQNRNVENTDIVVWHCFGLHHVVRPEDFPVQPCISCGFSLMPSGFFNLNPSNDLPRETNKASVLALGEPACHC
ncbi:primary-amine oxidase [Devosia sp.]|uniref:primary-amine oxidase n=1 Tax=Devosia sp. TaxID=1871048 RepID=UPI001AC39BF3|nr:primary-amine oxidase [Devosia sp.]MBN9335107.1 primary-amine oxidase [Devosia sp.]